MPVSRLLGIVPVKMFDSGLTLDFTDYPTDLQSFNFDAASDQPLLSNQSFQSGIGVVSSVAAEVLTVKGLSALELNPTSFSGGPEAFMSTIDGLTSFYGEANTNSFGWYWKQQPHAPGNWFANPWSWVPVSPGYDPGIVFNPSMMNLRGSPIIGTLVNELSSEVDLQPFITGVTGGLATPGGKLKTGAYSTFVGGASFLTSRLVNSPLFDNALFVSATGNHPVNQIIYWSSFIPASLGYCSQQFQTVTMDNAVLNAAFQDTGAPFIQSYQHGFIFPLVVNGAGPTRQRTEIAVFTADMSGYYLLSFEAMDAESASQLFNSTGHPQVKIDTDGIIWFNSGDAAQKTKALFSYSSGYNFPVYYFGSLQPIVLPCFVDSMQLGLYA